MKSFNLRFAVASLILFSAACKKDEPVDTVDSTVTSTKEMVVPANFDYSTSRSIDFDINSSNPWGKEKIRLDIYDFIPGGGGQVIASRFMEASGNLQGSFELPGLRNKVYGVLIFPDGSSVTKEIEVSGNSVNFDFSSHKSVRKSAPVSPNCNSGCDQSYNSHNGSITVNSNNPGGVYCITGNHNGNITINRSDVTVRVCGTAVINNLTLNSGSSLVVVDGAQLTIKNLQLNSSTGTITIFDADVTVERNFGTSGKVTNYGSLHMLAKYEVYSNGELKNYGSMDVGTTFANSNVLENNGSLDISGKLTLNSQSSTNNSCKITAASMEFNGPLTNEAYVSSIGKITFNSGGITTLKNSAMLVAGSTEINCAISGSGNTSMIKINGQSTINGGGVISGNLQFCDVNGIETLYGTIGSSVSQDCDLYLPTSSCNPEGNGSPQITDSDNDGVADDLDLYPNDPNASGASYYPTNGGFATLAFEDLWPYAGDYDFNDLVLAYRYTLVTNASNDVVRIEAQWNTRAIGAGLTNGFGVEFDFAPSAVSSVSGTLLTQNIITNNANGTEQGQSKATVIVFDNAFKTVRNIGGTKYVNTLAGEETKIGDTLNVLINFNSPMSLSAVGAAPFNPFIFVGGDRTKEVHLADHAPTDLASTALFGVGADDSSPSSGKYYKSEKNHPWALNIAGDFAYPQEKNDIVQGYTYFAAWAQSGGLNNTDWFTDLPSYRNTSKLY